MTANEIKPSDLDKEYEVIRQMIIDGNLIGLNTRQKIIYYKKFCEDIGLDPLSRPFDFIAQKDKNGQLVKLSLYANKTCANQLARINKLEIEIISHEQEGSDYVVKTRVINPAGGCSVEMGIVSLKKHIGGGKYVDLVGKESENAKMTAVTKSRRRAILGICGLGVLDETEADYSPDVKKIRAADVLSEDGAKIIEHEKESIVDTYKIREKLKDRFEYLIRSKECNEEQVKWINENKVKVDNMDYDTLNKLSDKFLNK